jgi:hypothetical protein
MNVIKLNPKNARPGNKSGRVASRLVQPHGVLGKPKLTEAQRRAILHAMLKVA